MKLMKQDLISMNYAELNNDGPDKGFEKCQNQAEISSIFIYNCVKKIHQSFYSIGKWSENNSIVFLAQNKSFNQFSLVLFI